MADAPIIRSAVDDLVDTYRSRPKGTPVVDPVNATGSSDYYQRMEYEDAPPTSSRTVIVSDEHGAESLTFVMHPNDKVVGGVAAKYAHLMSNQDLSHEDRRAVRDRMIQEIAEGKAKETKMAEEAREAGRVRTSPIPLDPSSGIGADPNRVIPAEVLNARPKKMWVTFSLGGLGSHRAAYDHVQLSNVTLLLASRLDDANGFFSPPHGPVLVAVDGMPAAVTAVYVDTYTFNGYHQIVMVIDRTSE